MASKKTWKKIERKSVVYYRPGPMPKECTPVVGMLKNRDSRIGRFGTKIVYEFVATEPGFCTSTKGEKKSWAAGDKVLVREYAGLRDLDELMGAEVRLTPGDERELENGNRVRDFTIEV